MKKINNITSHHIKKLKKKLTQPRNFHMTRVFQWDLPQDSNGDIASGIAAEKCSFHPDTGSHKKIPVQLDNSKLEDHGDYIRENKNYNRK